MTPSPYTEDTLVQQTTADYLEQQLGWESVYAHNHEDFGPNSLLGRASERDVVLARPLREKLAALNPGLPDGAYDEAVRRLTAATASQTIVAANHDKYDLARDGIQVTYRDDKGKPTQRRLRVIDFDEPANNHFLCVRELWVRGDLYRRRPDLVGFVNGLPLLFIECKNIHRDLKAAFEKNYADYRDTVPHLFHHNAVVMFGNGEKARVGTITSRWGHFHEWKRLAEDEPGAVDMETLLKGVCDRRNFLDLVENFILFVVACKETANENDGTRKRFEVLCREVFRKFRACINVRGVNAHRGDRDAIDVVYRSLQHDREQADISDIIRKLHEVVDAAIDVQADRTGDEDPIPYDISAIDFDRLKREFQRTREKRTTVQALKHTVEQRLQQLLARNPLRTDFQKHYEAIVAEYNREKDRVTIERTFEALLEFVQELEHEESRALREGLDEESLAIFDLLNKPDLERTDIERIKKVAQELLRTLKAEKLRVDQWRDKEATQSAVKVAIHDFLYSDETGLPADAYSVDDVAATSEAVFAHVYRAYPTVPSPCYDGIAAA